MQFSHKSTALCDREQAKTGLHHVMRRNLQHSTLPQPPLKKKPLTGSDATRYTTRTQGAKSSMLSQVQAVVRAVVLYSRRYMYKCTCTCMHMYFNQMFKEGVASMHSFTWQWNMYSGDSFWYFMFHVSATPSGSWGASSLLLYEATNNSGYWNTTQDKKQNVNVFIILDCCTGYLTPHPPTLRPLPFSPRWRWKLRGLSIFPKS